MGSHRQRVTVEFKNICLDIKEKNVLKGVSGVAEPGKLLAIMGPSGAGKTLLLTALAGRQHGSQTGQVVLNGRELDKTLRRQISFVLQEDLFMDQLTLRDTLMFTAQLRLPQSLSYKEKLAKVDNIVDTLDLRKCLDTKIGNSLQRGLSGGEKKRTNIGCELLTDPAVLLLDEPTSGLDSRTASELIVMLKKYAQRSGKTVITSIHQPSSNTFLKFDNLLLLSEGEVVYFGQAHHVTDYFAGIGLPCSQHYNPADFIMEKIKGTEEERNLVHQAARQQPWKDPSSDREKSVQTVSEGVAQIEEAKVIARYNRAPSAESIQDESHSKAVILTGPEMGPKYKILDGISIPNSKIESNNLDVHVQIDCAPPREKGRAVQHSHADKPLLSDNISSNTGHSGKERKKWPTGFWHQLLILSHRNFKQYRTIILSRLELFRHLLVGLFVGAFWFQTPHTEERIRDMTGMIFFFIVYWGFESINGAIGAFPQERAVITKERSSGAYRLSSYFFSKIFGELPLQLTLPFASTLVAYWMAGLNNSASAFFGFAGTILLNNQVARAMGLLIGAVSGSIPEAIVGTGLFMMASMLLGGFYVATLPLFLSWLQYLSVISYTYGGALSMVYTIDPQLIKCSTSEPSKFDECLPPNDANSSFMSGPLMVERYGSVYLSVWAYYTILLGVMLVFYVLAYLALRFFRKPS